jgi:hydrogenase maturation factor
VVGGHTEITYGLDRPILVGTMIGEVDRGNLVYPNGAQPGDRLLLTKGIPIEATTILAREFADQLENHFTEGELVRAREFFFSPGISVLREARLAVSAGKVNAMHDPTEGGLAAALWELAEASQCTLFIDLEAVPVFPLSQRICHAFSIDPYAAIASGALLLAVPEGEIFPVSKAIKAEGIPCTEIGKVLDGPATVLGKSGDVRKELQLPERDAIARLFDT